MRWLAMADSMGFDADRIDVHFLPGVFKLSEISARIAAEVERIGGVVLVVVDTSAAYFEGEDENGNVQMGIHARRMRELTKLPGQPCVVAACHPVKNAGPENLLPRGGGAFIAEMDGNLTCSKADQLVTMHWQGKYRGADFPRLRRFELRAVLKHLCMIMASRSGERDPCLSHGRPLGTPLSVEPASADLLAPQPF